MLRVKKARLGVNTLRHLLQQKLVTKSQAAYLFTINYDVVPTTNTGYHSSLNDYVMN